MTPCGVIDAHDSGSLARTCGTRALTTSVRCPPRGPTKFGGGTGPDCGNMSQSHLPLSGERPSTDSEPMTRGGDARTLRRRDNDIGRELPVAARLERPGRADPAAARMKSLRAIGADDRLYPLCVGVIVGLLAAGMFAPFVLADRVTTTAAATAGGAGSPNSDSSLAGSAAGSETAGSAGEGATVVEGSNSVQDAPSSGPSALPESGPGGLPDVALTATDVGVTESTITLGVAIADYSEAANYGYSYLLSGNDEGRYEALVEDLNRRGGIGGRTVQLAVATYGAVSNRAAEAQAACTSLVTDQRSFAVLAAGLLLPSGVQCFTDQGVPLIETLAAGSGYYASGFLISMYPTWDRTLRQHVAFLQERGMLEGRTIGVVTNSGAAVHSVQNSLVPALAALGYEVVDIEALNEDATMTQQLPVAVSNMQAEGVDLVINAAAPLANQLFVEQADRSGFRPTYAYSDFGGVTSDIFGAYPESFDGTIAATSTRIGEARAGIPVDATEQACLDRVGPVEPLEPGTLAYSIAMGQCAIFDTFVRGASAAGPHLTRSALLSGVETLGSFPLPGFGDGSLAPGKHDAMNNLRAVVYRNSCACWMLTDDEFRDYG